MKNRRIAAGAGLATFALALGLLTAPPAHAAPPLARDPEPRLRSDNLPHPLAEKQAALRQEAVAKLVRGEATTEQRGDQRVIRVPGAKRADGRRAKDRYVSYPVSRKESVFTVLSEFGSRTTAAGGGTPGPLHNAIPRPDRRWDGSAEDDNSTYWRSDFSRSHYQDLMFGANESFKDFYLKQSNGRFLATGDVSDWVRVPFNEARYGSNAVPDNDGSWNFIKDTATAWYEAQIAAGRTPAQIKAYLAQFDQVDRYDHDGDGNYNEPDGYIDHFQAIHAGEGEEAGGGAQGEDAIWSHRWYAFSSDQGRTGPSNNKAGGVPLGDSGLWIGDYTTEPENGGLGVFAHEFGHDLGLPDLYDTKGGDNSTAFWSLMSSGSWLNRGADAIGTTPGYMGAWEKLQLGWLDYATVTTSGTQKLGPADRDAVDRPQALIVPLPDKTVTTTYNTPHSGEHEWWSGSADNLNTTLTRTIDLSGATTASTSAWLWKDIEEGYDFLHVEVSLDGGSTWKDAVDPVTGTQKSWVRHDIDLTPYVGHKVDLRMRYATDGGVHQAGAFLDDITVTADGRTIVSDDVESADAGWTSTGFTRTTGRTTAKVPHSYLAENRVYGGYDATLRTGPYNYGWPATRPQWVERFPYQNGLLVTYVDGEYTDNNTSQHPGHGQVLPVDARPAPITFPDGVLLGNRRQPFDATFGQERTDPVTFHHNGTALRVPSSKAVPTFDDAYPKKYWTADNPLASVQVAGSGLRMTVARTTSRGENMDVRVTIPSSWRR